MFGWLRQKKEKRWEEILHGYAIIRPETIHIKWWFDWPSEEKDTDVNWIEGDEMIYHLLKKNEQKIRKELKDSFITDVEIGEDGSIKLLLKSKTYFYL